jgi:hypothetical protein
VGVSCVRVAAMAVCVSNMASLSASSGCQALRVPTDVVKEWSRSVRSLRGRASLGASLCGRASETEPINQSQNAFLRLVNMFFHFLLHF